MAIEWVYGELVEWCWPGKTRRIQRTPRPHCHYVGQKKPTWKSWIEPGPMPVDVGFVLDGVALG